jgi:phosphatidylserine/phosphatidylglycerophosphate/cardiolipin synthase-like enzyme
MENLIKDLIASAKGELKDKWFYQQWKFEDWQKARGNKDFSQICSQVFNHPDFENLHSDEKAQAVSKIHTLWEKFTYQVYFSPGEETREEIVSQIIKAKSKIDICVFTLSDNRITDALIQAWHNGIDIRIITDNDKQFDKGSDIEELSDNGISIRKDLTKHHMHHKFAIFDDLKLLTGSYNWTRSAETSNQENTIITENKFLIEQYQDIFKELWRKFE